MEKIYTFVGLDEGYNLINIQNKIKELNIEEAEQVKVDLSESSFSYLIEVLNTPSFFYLNKIVILYGIDEDFSNEDLIKYLDSPSDNVILFISIKDKKYKLYNALSKKSLIIESTPLTEENLSSYIKAKLNELGYKADDKAIELLKERSLNDYALLNNNLDKLICYKAEEKVISQSDVEMLVTRNIDDNVYDLIKELIKRNKGKAYDIYVDLKNNNTQDSAILASLIYKFKEMYITKKLSLAKTSYDEMAEIHNLKNPKQMYYLVKDVQNIDLKTIETKLNELLDMDYRSKIGLINIKESLELFILK